MPDAEIIPIGSTGRPGRGTGRSKPSSATRKLAGVPAKPAPAKKSAAKKTAAKKTAAKKTAAKKTAAKKTASKKAVTKKAAPATKAAPAQKSAAAKKAAPTKRAASPKKSAAAEQIVPAQRTASEASAASQTSQAAPDKSGVFNPRDLPSELLAAAEFAAREVFGADWERQLAKVLYVLRKRMTGDYEVDDFGFDAQLTETFLLQLLRPLAEKYFRVEVRGIENIPAEGGALLVSNHSGTIPVDGLITAFVVHEHAGRFLRPLGADLVFKLPIVSSVARKLGTTLACQADAERMLNNGELVGVWPEGFKGVGKPFSERYKLQRFGRGGFVSAALSAGVPIVPLSVVGAEEIYPLIGNVPSLARLLGLPYLPITPFFPWLGPLGMLPLPSKWILEFGEPIRTDAYDPIEADDPMLVFNLTDQVRESIQQTLYSLLRRRESIFR